MSDNTPDVEVADTKPNDPFGFEKLTMTELRKIIAEFVRSNEELLADKKAYVDSINEVVKDTKGKIKSALEFLQLAEAAHKDNVHENNVTDFLKSVSK